MRASHLAPLNQYRLPGGASRLAALLAQIFPISSLVAPCHPGAALRQSALIQRRPATFDRGFSLIEAVVATAVMAGAIMLLAHLMTVCARMNTVAHHRTMTALFAQQKLEELRAEAVLDETARIDEFLDADGAILCRAGDPCAGAVYLRQWSVQLSAIVPPAVFVHVRARPADSGAADVHLITMRPRIRR